MALAGALGEVFVEVSPLTAGFAKKLETQVKEATDEATGKSSSMFESLAGAGKTAMFGIGAAALAVVPFALKMADAFEASHARLEVAFKNAGTSVDAFTKQITAEEASFEKLGTTNADYENALATLTSIVKDPTKALADMGIVADLAAAKHMDLNKAATLVGKVAEGNTAILARYGIVLDTAGGKASQIAKAQDALTKATTAIGPAADKVTQAEANLASVQEKVTTGHLKGQAAADALRKAHDAVTKADAGLTAAHQKVTDAQTKLTSTTNASGDAITALGQKFAGSASAQADTFGGKVKALEVTAEDLGAKLGMWLIPKLEELASATLTVVEFLERHRLVAEALAAVIGGALSTAIAAYIIQQGIALAQTIALVAAKVADLAETAALAAMYGGDALASIGSWIAAQAVMLAGHVAAVAGWLAEAAAATVAFIAENLATLGIASLIALLITGIIYLATHWKESWAAISGFVRDAAASITSFLQPLISFIGSLVDFIDAHWKLLIIIMTGGLAVIALGIAQHINTIRSVFETLIGWLVDEWRLTWEVVTAVYNTALTIIEAAAMFLWHNIFEPVFTGINAVIQFYIAGWTATFNVFLGFITGPVAGAFGWLWHNIIEPVFNGIASTIGGAWGIAQGALQSGINFLGGAFTDAFHTLQTVLSSIWTGIQTEAGRVWDSITTTIKGAVNTMIDVIRGLIGGINTVLTAVVGKGAEIPLPDKLEAGGTVTRTGPGLITNGPMAIVGEGRRQYPEFVVPTDPQYRNNASRLLGTAAKVMGMSELPAMKSGGILGAFDAVGGDIAGLAKDVGKYASDIGGDVLGLLRKGAVDLILDPVFAAANATVGKVSVPFIRDMLPAMEKDIKDWVTGVSTSEQALAAAQAAVGSGPGGPGYSTLTSWLGVPYLWGGGHNVSEAVARRLGVDCSGLVDQVFGQTGNTGTQVNIGATVSRADSMPGDLAFFGSRAANEPHHVGIITGAGGTQMINAPHTGTVVRYDPLFSDLEIIKRWPNSPSAIGTLTGGIPIPGVGVPGGSSFTMNTVGDFANNLMLAGGWPLNPANAGSVARWAQAEGGYFHNNASFNPLNTTMHEPGSTSINSVGVQAFVDAAEGFAATVATINNGNYPNIITSLRSGQGLGPVDDADLTKWGTGPIFDTGGWMMPGTTGRNTGSQPELVLNPSQSRAYVNGNNGTTIEIHHDFHPTIHSLGDGSDVEQRLRAMMDDEFRQLAGMIAQRTK